MARPAFSQAAAVKLLNLLLFTNSNAALSSPASMKHETILLGLPIDGP
jgi:hypothetical protein